MVIDPQYPWKLIRRSGFKSSPYRMSVSELKTLIDHAEGGDAEAEWQVAGLYEDGCVDKRHEILVRRSWPKYMEWLRRAAEHGCSPAQNALGVELSNKDRGIKRMEEAFVWLKKAYRAGDTIAANNIAVTYREIGNLKMAVKWFQKSIETGDDETPVQLGVHYYWGRGVRKNSKVAVRCFRTTAYGDNVSGYGRDDAFFYLGLAYFEGKGVKKSILTARKMFERANVDNDHPWAAKMLLQLNAKSNQKHLR